MVLPPGFRVTPSGLRGPPQFQVPELPPGYYFTPNGLRGSTDFSFESLVRPFTSVFSFSTPRLPPEPAVQEPEAFIEWGGPSVFSFDDTFRELAGAGTAKKDDDDNEPPEEHWTENGRSTSDVRVENPDDPDQFVIVQQIDSIGFTGPGGRRAQFQFSN